MTVQRLDTNYSALPASIRATRPEAFGAHFDAADSVFLTRQLEQLLSTLFDVKYAELAGRKLVGTVPVDPGADTVRRQGYDSRGVVKRIANAADDLPMGNATAFEEPNIPMISYGGAYQFTVQELAAASFAARNGAPGKNLDAIEAISTRKRLAQFIDSVIATGVAADGLLGILNQPSTQTCQSALSGVAWSTATADQIISDMMAVVDQVPAGTSEVEQAKRLILPAVQYRIASRKPRSTISDTTCLEFFRENRPEIEVVSWYRAAGAGNGTGLGTGDGTKDRMMAYDPDPVNLHLLMATEFDQLAPQLRNFAYVINCWTRTGGVRSPYPKSICYGDISA